MKEEWKDIEGFEGCYQVSNKGRVKSLARKYVTKERFIKPFKGSNGYLWTILSKKGRAKTYTIHRLVAKAFIPNPENNKCVNHIDNGKTNNRADNLEWCTHKENTLHAMKQGRMARGTSQGQHKLTENQVLEIREKHKTNNYSQRQLGKEYGVSHSTIGYILRRVNWRHI